MAPAESTPFSIDRDHAARLTETDPLGELRDRFHIPKREDGRPTVYLCGNSLGLQPRAVRPAVEKFLTEWEELGVEGHFDADPDWFSYHERFREIGARLVGGVPGEVVMMNSLTVNLHLMMVSFFRPTPERYKIVIEDGAFPSDTYAMQSHLHAHGLDPADALIRVRPPEGRATVPTETLEALLAEQGDRIALVALSGVQYLTGQLFDIERITRAGHAAGCKVGWDLAHAAGNVPLRLHDWNVDFAVWCSYKYLNSGPGAVAGCFVHERHGKDLDLPRFAGWWGNDPETRFRMDEMSRFIPRVGADGWQLSNPPILALAPVLVSLRLFDEVGMETLREKSLRLTGYLEFLLRERCGDTVEVVTPSNPDERGCQLSLRIRGNSQEGLRLLKQRGVICDFRPPDVIRAAPVPLYNSYLDVWEFVDTLVETLGG